MNSSRTSLTLAALTASVMLVACGKKPAPAPVETPPPAPVATTPAPTPAPAVAPAAEPTAEQREREDKQAKLDYAMMEDSHINDPRAQWASAAKASSSFGEVGDRVPKTPQESGAWKATGPMTGDADPWMNNSQNVGFDWLELSYAKPVSATEVRVIGNDRAIESLAKIELIDTDGKPHTVWSGLSDVKREERGRRSWFVKKFDATPYKVQGVKVSFANNVASGYKEVHAAQLVGD